MSPITTTQHDQPQVTSKDYVPFEDISYPKSIVVMSRWLKFEILSLYSYCHEWMMEKYEQVDPQDKMLGNYSAEPMPEPPVYEPWMDTMDKTCLNTFTHLVNHGILRLGGLPLDGAGQHFRIAEADIKLFEEGNLWDDPHNEEHLGGFYFVCHRTTRIQRPHLPRLCWYPFQTDVDTVDYQSYFRKMGITKGISLYPFNLTDHRPATGTRLGGEASNGGLGGGVTEDFRIGSFYSIII